MCEGVHANLTPCKNTSFTACTGIMFEKELKEILAVGNTNIEFISSNGKAWNEYVTLEKQYMFKRERSGNTLEIYFLYKRVR